MAIITDVRTRSEKDGRMASTKDVCLRRRRRCVRTTRLSIRRRAADCKCAVQVVVPVQEPDLSCEEMEAQAAQAAAALLRRIGSAWPEKNPSEVSALFCCRQAALCSPPLAAWLYADGLEENNHAVPLAADSKVHRTHVFASSTPACPEERRVSFDLDRIQIYEVTPYSEIYGLHPREFVFGKNCDVVPSGDTYGFIDFLAACQASQIAASACTDSTGEDEEGSCCESDEEDEVEWW